MNCSRAWLVGFVLTVSGMGYPPQEVDAIKIISISPSTDVPLRVGERVTIRVEAEYNLASAELGRITLVIQQGESGRRPLANENEVVQKGRARLVLSKEITIPDTNALQVFI